jgi:hypothetical protein
MSKTLLHKTLLPLLVLGALSIGRLQYLNKTSLPSRTGSKLEKKGLVLKLDSFRRTASEPTVSRENDLPTVTRENDLPIVTREHDLPKVGLCGMTKGANQYMQEWIDYNFAIGFDDIYIYENNDVFNATFWEPIQKEKGEKLHVIPYSRDIAERDAKETNGKKQGAAYTQCAKSFHNRSDYLAFFDDDEFLVLFKHPNVASMVRDHCPNGMLPLQCLVVTCWFLVIKTIELTVFDCSYKFSGSLAVCYYHFCCLFIFIFSADTA